MDKSFPCEYSFGDQLVMKLNDIDHNIAVRVERVSEDECESITVYLNQSSAYDLIEYVVSVIDQLKD